MKTLIAILLVAALQTYSAFGEEAVDFERYTGRFVVVGTEGGGEFQGILMAVMPDRLELVDGEGRILVLHRPAVVSLIALEKEKFFRDAAENRLIVMPTAFPINEGELHITNQEIVAVTVSYGLTEHVSVWGGSSIPGALANMRYSTILGSRGAWSVGSFAGMLWAEPQTAAALPYVIFSIGDPDRNGTAAVSVPLVFPMDQAPYLGGILAALGGKTILSSTAAVVLESWFFFGSDNGRWVALDLVALPAAVFRIAGGRFSWDVGAVIPLGLRETGGTLRLGGIMDGPVIPLPIISVTYRLR